MTLEQTELLVEIVAGLKHIRVLLVLILIWVMVLVWRPR